MDLKRCGNPKCDLHTYGEFCDDCEASKDYRQRITQLESENAALKIDNKELQLNFNALVREAQLSENRGAVEALEKAIAFYTELGVTPVIAELKQMRDSYQPHKGEE